MNASIDPRLLGMLSDARDTDRLETTEWREAFLALLQSSGKDRARFILDELTRLARTEKIGWQPELNTPYVNTMTSPANRRAGPVVGTRSP